MGRAERKAIIRQLENKRKSKILSYITSDRQNNLQLQAIIADDAIRPLHQQLESIGKQDNIDLFLYTRGGLLQTSWRIVKLFREYSKRFHVIVPFRAHSGGTQIALGADGIVMTELAELGPVDPSTSNEFNPRDPSNPARRLSISVEDVKAFLNLAEERAGLKGESNRLQTFSLLASKYDPLALGNVNRVYDEIRFLVRKVLATHMNPSREAEKIEKIVKALTETYTHEHIITRDEAEQIGLKIIRPDTAENKLIMELYEYYEKELKLNEPLDAETVLGNQPFTTISFDAVIMESLNSGLINQAEIDLFRQTIQIPAQPSQPPMQLPPQIGKIGVKYKIGKWVTIPEA